MLENGAEQLVLKLEQVFQGKEELISNGRLRVCLTASVIVFLNKCFEDTQQHSSFQNRIIDYLKQCVQSIHTLKIVQGPTFKFNTEIDISHFQAVQVLQIDKIAIGYVSGLQTLRSRIRVLNLSHCVDKINDILTLCGHDQSTAFAWHHLEVADFSFNTISSLDSSMRLLTSVRRLNLSHNELTSEDNEEEDEGEWMYLPEVTYLNLGYNQLIRVPSFPDNCCSKITNLVLRNNNLASLEGLETLINLESLDVSRNCISSFSPLSSLIQLHRLVSICCYGNPISYEKRYRIIVASCLSPSPRRVSIVLDDKELNAEELYNLGQSLEVDLSSYIPSRPYGTPVHMIQDGPEAFVSSGEYPRTPEEKRKTRKPVIRQPSIRNAGDEQHQQTSRTVSINQVETTEELEKLEKFKREAGEDYLVVRNQEQLKKDEEKYSFDSSSEQTNTASELANTTTEDLIHSPESPPSDKINIMQEVLNDEESGELFLVSVKFTEETNSEETIFVIIKDHEILETNTDVKVTSRLDLNGLLDVNKIPSDEKVSVVLKFSHVHKERKYREYLFDDEGQCEKFVALLKNFVRKPVNEDRIPDKYFKCLKCSKCYNTEEEISLCTNCGSSVVVEVMKDDLETTKLQQNKNVVTGRQPSMQDPDLIPNMVGHVPLPPDICISGKDTNTSKTKDENTPELNSEYGALVSTIHVKAKGNESHYEDSYNSDDYQSSPYSGTRQLLQGQNSPSAAMNISLDSLSGTGTRRVYNNKLQESPLASSYSSQSGSETRSSTPVAGKTSSKIHFSLESCTHCDHRLKLYLETRLFRGGEDEEFRCMIKCPVASYGCTQGIPALLVISNTIAYICKVTGIESTRPKDWLSIKACYLLTDLRYIEYGLQSQSFRLEFAEPSGCHTFLVGDKKRCENFLTTLRNVAKKAYGEKYKSLRVGKANLQTRANIRIQVFGTKDESLMFKGRRLYEQAMNFTDPPLIKNHKFWFRTIPQSMLGEEFIDWLISRKEASSYREAVHIGQLLLNAGAIQCFNKDCGFLEKDQYYHFNLPTAELREDESSDISQDNSMEPAEPTEVNTTIKQYFLAQWKDEEKSTPISMIISNSHIALAEENHQWPLPRLHDPPKVLSGPQFLLKKKQKIINITDVKLFTEFPCEIEIEFLNEDTQGSIEDDCWLVVLHSENSLKALLDAIKELWEDKFGIDLPVNICNQID